MYAMILLIKCYYCMTEQHLSSAMNHEADIEATSMFTMTKTTRLISIKFSVVLSHCRKKLSYCKYRL